MLNFKRIAAYIATAIALTLLAPFVALFCGYPKLGIYMFERGEFQRRSLIRLETYKAISNACDYKLSNSDFLACWEKAFDSEFAKRLAQK